MALPSTKKLSLPLPEEMHRELFAESRRTGIPATRLVRAALATWLEDRRRQRRREEIRRFASEQAAGEYDLDPALEAAAAEELVRFDEDDDAAR